MDPYLDYILWTLAVLTVAAGLIGTVIPAIPGALLVFAGLVIAASIDGFARVGIGTLSILFLMTAVAYAADMVATAYGARKTGAGKWAIAGAFIGSIIGIFFGIAGIILGPFIGAVAGELLATNDLKKAGISGTGAWLGILVGSAVKAALAIAMVGLFAVVYFFS